VLSPDEPQTQFEAEQRIFSSLKIPLEILTPEECRKRWPQGGFNGDTHAFYEPRAGTVKARESIIAATEALVAKGGRTQIGMATPGAASGGRLTDIKLSDGSRLSTGAVIFACGPWLPSVLPDVLTNFIARYRSEVFYFGSPPGDLSYHWERFPNIWQEGRGGYGSWIAGGGSGHGFKMGPVLGDYVADRALGIADPAEEKALFALQAHKPFESRRGLSG
jgi:sarcosine oxidase